MLVEPQYKSIQLAGSSDGAFRVEHEEGGFDLIAHSIYGYKITKQGPYEEIETQPVLGLFAVKKNGRWGFIDGEGNTLTPCIFENKKQFSREGVCEVTYKGRKGYINSVGTEFFED